jgi:hypothetical protein
MSQGLQQTVGIAAMNDAYADIINEHGRLHHQYTLLGKSTERTSATLKFYRLFGSHRRK